MNVSYRIWGARSFNSIKIVEIFKFKFSSIQAFSKVQSCSQPGEQFQGFIKSEVI